MCIKTTNKKLPIIGQFFVSLRIVNNVRVAYGI